MAIYDRFGNQVFAEDVLDDAELAAYYQSVQPYKMNEPVDICPRCEDPTSPSELQQYGGLCRMCDYALQEA